MTLTKEDLTAIKDLMKVTVDEELDAKLTEHLNERFAHFPTKNEFFARMDEIMGELKAIREEHSLLSHRVYEDHEQRIEKAEKKLNIQPVA